jgi:hypothetical protein
MYSVAYQIDYSTVLPIFYLLTKLSTPLPTLYNSCLRCIIPRPALSCAYEGGNGWYVSSFYNVSWMGAQVLPEIYNANLFGGNYGILEARYWYVVKRWSYDHSDSELQFSGASMPGPNPPGSTENSRSFWLQLNGDQNTQQPIVMSTYYAPLTP